MSILAKTLFTDWHEITREQAEEYAIHLFTKSNCDNPICLVSKHIRGIEFTEEDLYARINRGRTQGIERPGERIADTEDTCRSKFRHERMQVGALGLHRTAKKDKKRNGSHTREDEQISLF